MPPLHTKKTRTTPPLDEAIRLFLASWRRLPAVDRVEALLPLIDAVGEARSGVLRQVAKLLDERWPVYVPSMSRQRTRVVTVYSTFLQLVVALVEDADAEASDAETDDAVTQH